MRKKPLSKKEFENIYTRVPRLNVEIAVKTEKGIVLILRKSNGWENMWHIPGGTVYLGERLEETAVRIGEEELGVAVEVKRLLGYIHYPNIVRDGGLGWPVGILFLCETTDELPEVNEEGEKVSVFDKLPENIIGDQIQILVENRLAS